MLATATAYTRSLEAARATLTKAERAVTTARKRSTIDVWFIETALQRGDMAGYAKYLRSVADIAATVPALAEAARVALDAVSELEIQMCHRCSGTGEYNAPTRAMIRGRAYCFTCRGDGRSKEYRG